MRCCFRIARDSLLDLGARASKIYECFVIGLDPALDPALATSTGKMRRAKKCPRSKRAGASWSNLLRCSAAYAVLRPFFDFFVIDVTFATLTAFAAAARAEASAMLTICLFVF